MLVTSDTKVSHGLTSHIPSHITQQRGDGTNHTEGASAAPNEDLSYDQETFVNDEFRGELRSSNPMNRKIRSRIPHSARIKSNISRASYWTIKLLDGFEGARVCASYK